MKKSTICRFSLLWILLFSCNTLANENKDTFSFGFETKSLVHANYADAKVALDLWMNDLVKEENITINVVHYKTQHDIIKDFREKKLDIIVKDVVSYLEHYKSIDNNSEFLWTLSTQKNRLFYQYYMIVNKKSNIQSLFDIQGKVLSIKENDSLARVWFDTLTLKKFFKPYLSIINSQRLVSKQSRVVLETLFNKSDFAIVSNDTWDTMNKLNPSLKKRLKILYKSPAIFIPIIGAAKKIEQPQSIKHDLMRKFLNTASRAEESVSAKQIRTLIKFENVHILKKKELIPLFEFYNNYLGLKRKIP